ARRPDRARGAAFLDPILLLGSDPRAFLRLVYHELLRGHGQAARGVARAGVLQPHSLRDRIREAVVLPHEPLRPAVRAVAALLREPLRQVPELLRAAPLLDRARRRGALPDARVQGRLMALRTGRRQRAVDGAKIDAEMGEEKPEVVLPEKEVQVVLDEHARDEPGRTAPRRAPRRSKSP